MKSYVIYQNYDHTKVIGRIELEDDVDDEAIQECVLGPELRIGSDGSILEINGFGMFPRVNTDIRER